MAQMGTYQVSNVTVLFKFRPGELSHVGSGGGIWYVVGAANDVSPQRDDFLSLDELNRRIRYSRLGRYG